MIELLRMAVTVLENGGFGVNANIANLPILSGDTRPPNVLAIVEPTTAHTQLRDEILASGPYIIVDCETPTKGVGQPFSNVVDYTVELWVGYFAHLGNDYELQAQAKYTMRAILQAFDQGWFTAANRPIYGRLNSVGVMACLSRRVEYPKQQTYASNIAARASLELQVRDLLP